MKRFVKPELEIVHFNSGVITTSGCPCYCDYDEFCLFDSGTDCTKDKPAYCTCQVNYVPNTANCTPCPEYGH